MPLLSSASCLASAETGEKGKGDRLHGELALGLPSLEALPATPPSFDTPQSAVGTERRVGHAKLVIHRHS
jgi:hypothetical protein